MRENQPFVVRFLLKSVSRYYSIKRCQGSVDQVRGAIETIYDLGTLHADRWEGKDPALSLGIAVHSDHPEYWTEQLNFVLRANLRSGNKDDARQMPGEWNAGSR